MPRHGTLSLTRTVPNAPPKPSVADVSALVAEAIPHALNRQRMSELLSRHGVKDQAAAEKMIAEFKFVVAQNYYAAPKRLTAVKKAGDALATLHGLEAVAWARPYGW